MLYKDNYPINFGLTEGASRLYQIEQQISYTVEGYQYHNEIKTEVRIKVEQKTALNDVFSIQLLKQWQLKNDGADAVDLSMAELRKKLLIETDLQGKIKQVTNLPEIKDHWLEIRPAIAKKYAGDESAKELINDAIVLLYTDGGLNSAIQSSYLYHAILPGLLEQNFSKEGGYTFNSHREIPNALGQTALPFKIKVSLADYDEVQNSCLIKIDGEIDRDNFDQDSVTEMFSELLDEYNLNAHVDGFHLESHEYGSDGMPLQSSQLTQYAIEGVLMYRNSCILTLLTH
ncbi:hypothetical protein GJU39_13640 [Pedobacter petrophilus]|uniref:Uncharacterized protein n=1 Tax=Pedobacter petrophilus TaxID=1908241 RepID=A0A7K0G124_9SPHI|nr:hypothetical protein [Pedobacter petrophilus]MRX77130.1 hypothetical protein [Pedobacter petrophilus]